MTVSNLNFGAQVDDWCRQSEARLTAVFRESTQRVASIATNGIPVDTGFARASTRMSKESMPPIIPSSRGEKGKSYSAGDGEIATVIASAEIGDTLFWGVTASYSVFLEYGHSQQAPQGFVRLAAAQWQSIVSQVVVEAKSLSG